LFERLSEAVHKYFVWLLIGTYVCAALLSQPGLWIRHLTIAEIGIKGESALLSAPTIMLALLLFNAGFGTGRISWSRLKERLSTLCPRVAGNALVPWPLSLSSVTRCDGGTTEMRPKTSW
jgi:BASS family bile acid:Na+ symporter